MGTNLSQVFISNTDILNNSATFNDSNLFGSSTPTVGFWTNNNKYPEFVDTAADGVDAPLWSTTVDVTADDENVADTVVTVANPLWRYTSLQIVQGTAGNPIATPIIDTRNIRRVAVTSYQATAGHKTVLTPNATTFAGSTIGNVTIRVISRTTPVDQLSYYDQDATEYTILSGNDPFPLGAFNTTNHKAISVEVLGADFTNAATFIDKAKEAIEAHGVLSKLVTVTDGASTMTIQSKHLGYIFDVVVIENADDTDLIVGSAAANKMTETVTGQVLGSGNQWQVHSEEVRCRSRYGNFNRMYLPQNMPTYTAATGNYHRVVFEYEHNWPNSTGIAPAGAMNQAVVYVEDTTSTNLAAAVGTIPGTGGDTTVYLF